MVLCTACDPFKDRGCNVFLYKYTRRHYKSPNSKYALLSNFWISGFTRFFAPPRPGPPRGFSLSPRPTPPRPADFYPCPAPPRPAEKCSAPHIPDLDALQQRYLVKTQYCQKPGSRRKFIQSLPQTTGCNLMKFWQFSTHPKVPRVCGKLPKNLII